MNKVINNVINENSSEKLSTIEKCVKIISKINELKEIKSDLESKSPFLLSYKAHKLDENSLFNQLPKEICEDYLIA